jgi:hypothetical protein
MRDANVKILVIALACLVVLMARTGHTEGPPPPFRVTTRKADDRVRVRIQGERAVLTVTSPSGIGGSKIANDGERWPGKIILRLRLHGLERLQIGNGKELITASISSNGDHPTILSLMEEGKEEVPIDRSSPFWTEIRILDAQDHPAGKIPLEDGVFEVTVPRPLVASNPPTLTLDWIDFYR